MFKDDIGTNQLLGRRIRKLREAVDKTQHELAASAGLSAKNLGELERGRGNPSLKSLEGLAFALGVSLEVLFCFDQKGKSIEALRQEITERLQVAKPDVVKAIHKALQP